MRTPIEKSLWFIESHFSQDIGLDDVAAVCGLSRFQISRLFSHAVGTTVTAYVRGRRLTEAARALASGAVDIIEVAIQAGYGSHEAFTRAFREHFGVTPTEVRSRGTLAGLELVEPLREDPAVAVRLPPPRLVALGPLIIAGLARRFSVDDFAGIPSLWQEFHPHIATVPQRRDAATFGLVADMAAEGESYLYLAGVEVAGLADLDPRFTAIRLPAQRWAVFEHRGHVTTIASTLGAIFGVALPAAGLTAGDLPDLIERYDKRFDPWTGTGGFEIWIPLK
jgi:AraC family transcriptional regulator